MKIKEHLILRQVGEKYMIIDPGTGIVDLTHVYALNNTAARLWKQLKGIDFTVETIISLLKSNYKIDSEEAQRDAEMLLLNMKANHLLEEDGRQKDR